jgi:NAD(P)-dependent dehydrogenase (short-subunit alcohol dehydrogenase family)
MSSSKAVVLITGASSGFGKVTSEILAENGYWVFGTSRSPASTASPKGVEMLELDVTSDESVKSCVGALLAKTNGALDILISNAGVVTRGAIEEMTVDDAKSLLDTNLFGSLRMIRAVLPTMRAAKRGKIIFMGSMAGQITVPFEGMYCVSKFALEGFAEQLRMEVEPFGIKVSILEPGFFKTNLFTSPREPSVTIEDYKEIKARALKRLRGFDEAGEDPVLVAREILKIAHEKNPKLRYPVGKLKSGLFYKKILPERTFENGVKRRFDLDKVEPV